jgi:voltage-gated potassium channel
LICQGNPTDETLLQEVGIQRARALVTVLPDDATNVFITLTARELNPNLMILARGELPSTEKKLRLAGADHIVLPDTISAMRLANLMTRPTALDFLSQPDERTYLNELLAQIDVQMEELPIPITSPMTGKSVRELEVRGKGAFMVVALRRSGGSILMRPSPSQLVGGGDTLIVLGHRGELTQFAQRFLKPLQARRARA